MLLSLSNFKGKTIAIIPARKGSTRIKNKNLQKIGKNSLIRNSLRTCYSSNIFDEIIVSTDSSLIEKESKDLATIINRRSALNSTSTSTTESVISEVINAYPKIFDKNTIIYLVQCTFPFLKVSDLKESYELVKNGHDYHCIISGYLFNKFIWEKDNKNKNNWLPTNYDPNNRPRSQDKSPLFIENGAFYIFGAPNFKQTNCRIHGSVKDFLMEEVRSIDIDVKDDLDYSVYLSGYFEGK